MIPLSARDGALPADSGGATPGAVSSSAFPRSRETGTL